MSDAEQAERSNRTERDRFIEAFGSDFCRVLDSFGIADRDATGADRYRRRVAYSLYIRYALLGSGSWKRTL
jgi:hypothetical protein